MSSSIKLCLFLLPMLFASLVIAQHAPKDPNYITDDGNDQCTVGASPPGGTPPAPDNKDCPLKKKGDGGGDAAPKDGATPPAPDNKDCPLKKKGDGGGDAAPKDGATPPAAPPADGQGGQGGGGSPNKDCPNKDKGQGGGDAAPKDGATPPAAPPADGQGGQGGGGSPNKDCPNKDKGQGGGATPPAAPPADGQGGQGGGGSPNKDCPNKDKGQGGGDAAPKDGATPPAPAPGDKKDGAIPPAPGDKKDGAIPPAPGDKKDGATPPAAPPADGQGGQGGGGSPNKDCPIKDKGQGGGDAAPKDGATPPAPAPGDKKDGATPPAAPPADGQGGQGGGGSPNKDCPNKDKGQGGGDTAPKDGATPPAPAPGDKKDGAIPPAPGDKKDGATPPAAPPADGQGGQGGGGSPNKDCPNKDKGQGGGEAAPKDGATPPADKKDGAIPPSPGDKKDGATPPAAPPADRQGGQGGGGSPNKDCPNKNKGQGGGGAPADGQGGSAPPADVKGNAADGGAGKAPVYGGNDVKASFFGPPLYQQPPLEPKYMGEWKLQNPNVGVSAMQYQLMPNNRAVWFDTTILGPSALELGPKGNCPPNPDINNEPDCYAHAVSYDFESAAVTPIYIKYDPWCSSGHMLPNGDLMSTGGNKMGFKTIRVLNGNSPTPAFVEKENALGANRWYASNCVLEDGSAVVVGGRDSFSYDLVQPSIDGKVQTFDFPFLQQTTDPPAGQGLYVENNLYPFVYLLPDGNVFIFANDRAIAFNPKTGKTVKEFPPLEGASRNYPASGMAALFPIRLSPKFDQPINIEVVVCGGSTHDAISKVDKRYTQDRVFVPANTDCNRIKVMTEKPVWEKEQDMPTPRTMGDLLQLPNSQFLFINGAKKGCSGWEDGEDPNLTPTLYMPENEMGKRFKELTPTTIPRMYHSISSVLPDGKILVAGSNAHQFYTFDGPYYPTDLRVEKFSPPYLDPALDNDRPVINFGTDIVLKYGKPFKVQFTLKSNKKLGYGDVILTMLYPPFTTHGFSQNQRMLIVGVEGVDNNVISAVAPPSGKVAPPGYYLMFVNHRSVPSAGIWVHLD